MAVPLKDRFPWHDESHRVVSKPLVSDHTAWSILTFHLKRQSGLINVIQRGERVGYGFFFERRDAAAIDDCAT